VNKTSVENKGVMRFRSTSRAFATAIAVAATQAPSECQEYVRYEGVPMEMVESRLKGSGSPRGAIDFARERHADLLTELHAAAEMRDELRGWVNGHWIRGDVFMGNEAVRRRLVHFAIGEHYSLGAREEEAEFLDAVRARADVSDEVIDRLARDRRRQRVTPLRHGPNEWPAYTSLLDVSAWAAKELEGQARSPDVLAELHAYEVALDPMLVEMDGLAATRVGDMVRQFQQARPLQDEGRMSDAAARRILERPLRGAALIAEARALNEATLEQLAALVPDRAGAILAAQRRHEAAQIVPEHAALASRLASAIARDDLAPEWQDSLAAIRDRLDAERERHEAIVMRRLASVRTRSHQEAMWIAVLRSQVGDAGSGTARQYEPPELAAYNEAMQAWRESIKALGREVSLILGEEAER
jgi:hypothetical protein